MNKKPPKYEPERHPLDYVFLFPYKFQCLKPLAGNSIKPRKLSQDLALGRSVKTWLSDAQSRPGSQTLSQDLVLGCSQLRPGSLERSVKTWLSEALSQDLALVRSQSRPGSRKLSVKTWHLEALSQDLALGRSVKSWLSEALSQDLALGHSQDLVPHVLQATTF
jgi:hypothetical protein